MLERIIAVFRPASPIVDVTHNRQEAKLISQYVDVLNKYGLSSAEETAFYTAIQEQRPDLAELCWTAGELSFQFEYNDKFEL